jgi:hypothetical protein
MEQQEQLQEDVIRATTIMAIVVTSASIDDGMVVERRQR